MAAAGDIPAGDLTAFVGRSGELTELPRLLGAARLVTVTGGMGTSRLALRAAARVRDRFAHGVWTVEPSGRREPVLLERTAADALRRPDHAVRAPRRAPAEHLADRELLLLLDGFGRLHDRCADPVADLLRHAPGLLVPAAGRRPLGMAGERLAPAPAPPAGGPAATGRQA